MTQWCVSGFCTSRPGSRAPLWDKFIFWLTGSRERPEYAWICPVDKPEAQELVHLEHFKTIKGAKEYLQTVCQGMGRGP